MPRTRCLPFFQCIDSSEPISQIVKYNLSLLFSLSKLVVNKSYEAYSIFLINKFFKLPDVQQGEMA